jgi:hypothetical protein
MLRIATKRKGNSRKPTARERAELKKITLEVLYLKKAVVIDSHKLGTKLIEVRERKRWLGGNYQNFDDWLVRGAKFEKSRRTAYRYIGLAEAIPADLAERLGPEKLDLVAAFLAATSKKQSKEEVARLTIAVPTKKGGIIEKRVDEVTPGELAEATKAANARKQARALESLPGAHAAERLAERGRKALKDAKVEGVKIVVSPGNGEPKLAIHNLRVSNAWEAVMVIARGFRGE